jgi:pyruvate/2-oxoacid:ferredoxin oxidoreductase beta subunit
VAKAKGMRGGLRFIVVLTPCLAGWGIGDNQAVKVSRLAVESGFFPLYEVEHGEEYTINHGKTGSVPVGDYLRAQRRYRHLDEAQVAELQGQVDHAWQVLLAKAAGCLTRA